jgi:NTP pyrophosphatase (non-canonical NTP hydrolase)
LRRDHYPDKEIEQGMAKWVRFWEEPPEGNPMKFSNQLTDAQAERLAILLEEMGEAQQAIGKILRHGYDSFNPDFAPVSNNRDDLARELGDVQYAINILIGNGDLDRFSLLKRTNEKPNKIAPYLHHQPEPRKG